LCKANIWPGFAIKNLTVQQMVEKVLSIYYPGNAPTLYSDDAANRKVLGLTGAYNAKDRSAKAKKLIERSQAHPNEGAFEFISRNLRRHGLWIWATADGGIVISGPDYDQEPSYRVIRKRGERGANWPSASYRWDRTNVPTYLCVRGKSTQKEWEKSAIQGVSTDPNAYPGIIEPAYIQHDEATTKEQCETFARQEMSRLKQQERVYTVTATGHRDRTTGNIFAVNTIATIDDEFTGVQEDMFVIGRTFRKDTSGTTTELRCVPLGSIQFSDVDWA
jgi:prophage tail gpP-like protein